VVEVVAAMVDDAQVETRQPSHWDIEQQFRRSDLLEADPWKSGPQVGKRKRVQAVLNWALEYEAEKGEKLVGMIISLIRSKGGFRPDSQNFIGHEIIKNAQDVFRSEGFDIHANGEVLQGLLDNLGGVQLTEALRTYVRRARRGALDAALVTGTGKDLVEATAAHVLQERFGSYSTPANFPTLLGQAYASLGLCFDREAAVSPQDRVDSALCECACAVNGLRNKEGTGHGRPFLPGVTRAQARIAIEIMGVVSERLLLKATDDR
jgi:hypothetical protein